MLPPASATRCRKSGCQRRCRRRNRTQATRCRSPRRPPVNRSHPRHRFAASRLSSTVVATAVAVRPVRVNVPEATSRARLSPSALPPITPSKVSTVRLAGAGVDRQRRCRQRSGRPRHFPVPVPAVCRPAMVLVWSLPSSSTPLVFATAFAEHDYCPARDCAAVAHLQGAVANRRGSTVGIRRPSASGRRDPSLMRPTMPVPEMPS